MLTKFIEATNYGQGGINWGKFAVMKFTAEEWAYRSVISPGPLLAPRGWSGDHVFVLDLQTGEGSLFAPHGLARADLQKHKIWVCPLFEPFLEWLYKQDLADITKLPPAVRFTEAEAPSAVAGYRRPGTDEAAPMPQLPKPKKVVKRPLDRLQSTMIDCGMGDPAFCMDRPGVCDACRATCERRTKRRASR